MFTWLIYAEDLCRDGTTLVHTGTILKHDLRTLEYDGLAYVLTLKGQRLAHDTQGSYRHPERSYRLGQGSYRHVQGIKAYPCDVLKIFIHLHFISVYLRKCLYFFSRSL